MLDLNLLSDAPASTETTHRLTTEAVDNFQTCLTAVHEVSGEKLKGVNETRIRGYLIWHTLTQNPELVSCELLSMLNDPRHKQTTVLTRKVVYRRAGEADEVLTMLSQFRQAVRRGLDKRVTNSQILDAVSRAALSQDADWTPDSVCRELGE